MTQGGGTRSRTEVLGRIDPGVIKRERWAKTMVSGKWWAPPTPIIAMQECALFNNLGWAP